MGTDVLRIVKCLFAGVFILACGGNTEDADTPVATSDAELSDGNLSDGEGTESGDSEERGQEAEGGLLEGTHIYTTAGGFEFSPDLVTVEVDELVHFHLAEGHTAVEVNFETWQKGQTTPLEGGFYFGLEDEIGSVSFDRPGTHYFVCLPHAEMGMRGQVIVE